MERIPLSEDELISIKKRYKYNLEKFKRNLVISSIVGLAALFVKTDAWFRFGWYQPEEIPDIPPKSNLLEVWGTVPAILIILGIIGIILLISYRLFLRSFKKDMKLKLKTRGTYEVARIQLISQNYASMLDGDDAILHFKRKDGTPVKHVFFNQEENPDWLKAKKMTIERAQYSYIHFKVELLE
ncbi:hypothetical protein [Spongiivirga citrea]|uniref:Uncharacterized protein n=1 Tax=Spongiivirga citrea TaxID=1481457 RepID=A0A6M0CIY8_9FLAO|nr:hypothetical protein [Spongiivirga citrea]NER17492.1 hypothetical protein [Spongiivirga citrea]